MDLTCRFGGLIVVDKGVYVPNDVNQLAYPKSIKQLKSGTIDSLIMGFVIT